MRPHLTDFVPPPKFARLLKTRKQVKSILDVGCASSSPRQAKRWFPNASYSAIDLDRAHNSAEIDHFYLADLRSDDLSAVPDRSFDLILFVQVIEHLENGEEVIRRLAKKLSPTGTIYVECPSVGSVDLPSGVSTLNFYDDPTHVRLYSQGELVAAAIGSGLEVIESGIARDPLWMVMGVTALVPKQIYCFLRYQKPFGPGLWDWVGFRQYVLARSTAG